MVQTRSATKTTQSNDVENAKKCALPAPLEEDSSDDLADAPEGEDISYHPVKKRSKRAQGKGTQAKEVTRRPRQRGRLEMLPELNLDVLFQILGFLHPLDLLNLARTTTAFRQLLMRKSSAFIWKTARSQIGGFPDCPSDLSEPQYANLAFYPHCYGCGNTVPTIHWRLRLRYCPACRKAEIYSGFPSYHDGVLPLEYLKLYHKRHGDYFVDIKQRDSFLAEYNKLSKVQRDVFMTERRKLVSDIDKHAAKCEAWHQGIIVARKCELSDARAARAESILARLKGIGYGAEIDYFGLDQIAALRGDVFHSTKRLTDREWEHVGQKLEETMNDFRMRRMEMQLYNPRQRLLVKLYDDYVQKPALDGGAVDLLPSVADLAKCAAFDAVIKLPEVNGVEPDAFKPAFEQLPISVLQWRENVERQLASLVVVPIDPRQPSERLL
ncbi:hypothetical protein HYDPIDRAFT_32099 [Hydnomerulius pinastri MD-312]|uniref:F-box domain-containing protein n=1 Tax=Hydnomerulius pinastri MD-312 TaxID=994086 RepID=A0A0C9W3F5_9AGAM|nr:hypothetical protein HYDPIDRAFT_32099 [Hydnomerulius pinastri MD-312]